MGKGRWLYENYITAASMITPSSAAVGLVAAVQPDNQGSAVMSAQGNYTGDDDTLYTVQIDNVDAGQEIGQATFRWKKGSATWSATGVATASTLTTLDNAVQIKWTAGSGDDFELYDTWRFYARRRNGRGSLVDGNPDSEWRSTGVSDENLVFDLGSAQTPTALIIGHHNLTSGVTITLQANASDSWGSPSYSQAISWASGIIGYFLSGQNYRYWRIRLQDATNTDGYLRMALIYLGTYSEPSRNHHWAPYDRAKRASREDLEVGGMLAGANMVGVSGLIRLAYTMATSADLTIFEALFDAVHDRDNQLVVPCWFVPNYSSPNDALYGLVQPEYIRIPCRPDFALQRVDFDFAEIARTVCSC